MGVLVGNGVGVGVAVAVGVGVGAGVSIGTGVGVGVGLGLGEGAGVPVGTGTGEGAGVAVGLGEGASVPVGTGTGEGAGVAVGSGEGVGVGVGVAVGSGLLVDSGIGAGVAVGSGGGKGVSVGTGVGMGLVVGTGVGVSEDVVAVGTGEGSTWFTQAITDAAKNSDSRTISGPWTHCPTCIVARPDRCFLKPYGQRDYTLDGPSICPYSIRLNDSARRTGKHRSDAGRSIRCRRDEARFPRVPVLQPVPRPDSARAHAARDSTPRSTLGQILAARYGTRRGGDEAPSAPSLVGDHADMTTPSRHGVIQVATAGAPLVDVHRGGVRESYCRLLIISRIPEATTAERPSSTAGGEPSAGRVHGPVVSHARRFCKSGEKSAGRRVYGV